MAQVAAEVWAEHVLADKCNTVKAYIQQWPQRWYLSMDDHNMKLMIGHSRKRRNFPVLPSGANSLGGIRGSNVQIFVLDKNVACHVLIGREILGMSRPVELEEFLPLGIPEDLLLGRICSLEVVIKHCLNHKEGVFLLLSFPSFSSGFSCLHCGSRLSGRSVLISKPIVRAPVLFFLFLAGWITITLGLTLTRSSDSFSSLTSKY